MEMIEKKEEMSRDICRKFGFEDIHTLIFFGLCEDKMVSNSTIFETYDMYMEL